MLYVFQDISIAKVIGKIQLYVCVYACVTLHDFEGSQAGAAVAGFPAPTNQLPNSQLPSASRAIQESTSSLSRFRSTTACSSRLLHHNHTRGHHQRIHNGINHASYALPSRQTRLLPTLPLYSRRPLNVHQPPARPAAATSSPARRLPRLSAPANPASTAPEDHWHDQRPRPRARARLRTWQLPLEF